MKTAIPFFEGMNRLLASLSTLLDQEQLVFISQYSTLVSPFSILELKFQNFGRSVTVKSFMSWAFRSRFP